MTQKIGKAGACPDAHKKKNYQRTSLRYINACRTLKSFGYTPAVEKAKNKTGYYYNYFCLKDIEFAKFLLANPRPEWDDSDEGELWAEWEDAWSDILFRQRHTPESKLSVVSAIFEVTNPSAAHEDIFKHLINYGYNRRLGKLNSPEEAASRIQDISLIGVPELLRHYLNTQLKGKFTEKDIQLIYIDGGEA